MVPPCLPSDKPLFSGTIIYALAHDNGSNPARPTINFSLLLAGVFHELPLLRRTAPQLSESLRPLLLPRIAFRFMEKNITPVKKKSQARNKPLYHYFSNHLRLIVFRQLLENRQRTLNHSRIYAISSTEIPGTPEIRPRNQKQIILFRAFTKRIIIIFQSFRK